MVGCPQCVLMSIRPNGLAPRSRVSECEIRKNSQISKRTGTKLKGAMAQIRFDMLKRSDPGLRLVGSSSHVSDSTWDERRIAMPEFQVKYQLGEKDKPRRDQRVQS